MEPLLFYAIPSISAIAIKIVLFWYGRHILKEASAWIMGFLGGLFGVNVCELVVFWFVNDAERQLALAVLSMYYVCALVANGCFLGISLKIAGRLSKFLIGAILLTTAVGIITVVIPGWAIAGAQSIGYSVSRIAGPLYWVVQILIVVPLTASTAILALTAFWSANWIRKRRALALLIATSPVVFCVLTMMGLMQAGVEVNAAVVVSFSINILLAVIVYTEYESGIFRFLSFIPRTAENRLIAHAAYSAYDLSSQGLNGAVANFEKALITDALLRCNGNKTVAADMLGVSRATLRRKLSS